MCFFHRMVTAPSRVIILRHFKEAEPQEVNPHSGKAPRALQGRRDDVLEPENPVSARRGRQGPTSTHTLPREQPCGRGVSSKVGAPPPPHHGQPSQAGAETGQSTRDHGRGSPHSVVSSQPSVGANESLLRLSFVGSVVYSRKNGSRALSPFPGAPSLGTQNPCS